jgi:hypothetical protein
MKIKIDCDACEVAEFIDSMVDRALRNEKKDALLKKQMLRENIDLGNRVKELELEREKKNVNP